MSTSIDPFAFIKIARQEPKKISPETRVQSFKEIYQAWTEYRQPEDQASRCLSCGNPYCSWGCPLNNYIPDWLNLIENGHWKQAAELMYATNPLPEICGRVCPQDRLCEGACTLNDGLGAVTIGFLEKTITDYALDQGWKPTKPTQKKFEASVAVIGSGPAGLGCADYLARQGVQVDVYERASEIGGLLRFGIPSFKLEKNLLLRRRAWLEHLGVNFYLNQTVGEDILLENLLENYDAIFTATGCYQAVTGEFPGENLKGVYPALSFLQQYACDLPSDPSDALHDQKVIVLGGGDTAMDCTRTARRLGAKEVYCVYRRQANDMPGSRREVNNAKEEGVQFIFQQQPIEISRNEDSKSALCLQLSSTQNAKRSLMYADRIIIAFGFSPEVLPWLNASGVMRDVRGRIVVDQSHLPFQTQHPQIFAGGDIVRGADLVVTAIADGLKAAQSIMRYLTQKKLQISTRSLSTSY